MYNKAILSSIYLLIYYLFKVLPRELFGRNKLRFVSEKEVFLRDTILCLSYIEWDATFQRPHHLVQGLSKKYNVYYCAPIRAHNVDSLSWAIENFERKISETLTVLIPLVIPGERTVKNEFFNRIIRKINSKIILTRLIEYLNKKEIAHLTIYTNSPFFLDVIKGLKLDFLIYDVMDDLISFPDAPKNASQTEDELFELSDLVFTGTYSIYEIKKNKHRNIHFIQCGVDYQHFAMDNIEETKELLDMKEIKKPIIGYFGALNERLDCELIKKIAYERTGWSLVMIGPKYESVVNLPMAKNIFYLGKKHYKDLPKYLNEFDVAIVPYSLKGGTQFVNPVKVLEYLSGGKPVVSTAIPDVKRFFSEYVYIADNEKDFIKKIEEALKNNTPEAETKRKEFAKKRSWEMMVEEMTTLYKKSLEQKR
jgi:UDP-galactopyranose mutase